MQLTVHAVCRDSFRLYQASWPMQDMTICGSAAIDMLKWASTSSLGILNTPDQVHCTDLIMTDNIDCDAL